MNNNQITKSQRRYLEVSGEKLIQTSIFFISANLEEANQHFYSVQCYVEQSTILRVLAFKILQPCQLFHLQFQTYQSAHMIIQTTASVKSHSLRCLKIGWKKGLRSHQYLIP